MCTGTEYAIAQGIGAAVSAAGAYKGYKAQQESAKMAQRAEQERRKAESDAAAAANFRMAEARRALRANSLFTGGGTAGSATSPGAASGQTTLGAGG